MELDLDSTWRPSNITCDDIKLELKHPIAVVIEERGEGLFVASFDALGISSFGSTPEETKDAFEQEFIVLWKEIAEEDDKNLSKDAINLKQEIINLVKSQNIV